MKPYYLDVLEKRVPGKDLARELLRRIKVRVVGAADHGRQVWTPADVIDADGRALELALSPDRATLFVKGHGGLMLVDVKAWKIRQHW